MAASIDETGLLASLDVDTRHALDALQPSLLLQNYAA